MKFEIERNGIKIIPQCELARRNVSGLSCVAYLESLGLMLDGEFRVDAQSLQEIDEKCGTPP